MLESCVVKPVLPKAYASTPGHFGSPRKGFEVAMYCAVAPPRECPTNVGFPSSVRNDESDAFPSSPFAYSHIAFIVNRAAGKTHSSPEKFVQNSRSESVPGRETTSDLEIDVASRDSITGAQLLLLPPIGR